MRRRALHQDAALDGALVRDADLAVGEVAQPAVDELRAPARGPEREIVGVDRGDGQPAGGGVEGDAGAGDAEPDHEQVDVGAGGSRGRARRGARGVTGPGTGRGAAELAVEPAPRVASSSIMLARRARRSAR